MGTDRAQDSHFGLLTFLNYNILTRSNSHLDTSGKGYHGSLLGILDLLGPDKFVVFGFRSNKKGKGLSIEPQLMELRLPYSPED